MASARPIDWAERPGWRSMRRVVGFIRRLLSVVRVARLLSEDGTQAERK
jgi:hypothetical protein